MSLGSPGRSWPGRSAEGGRGPYTSLQEEGSEGRTTCMGCRRLGTKRRRIYSLLLGQLLSVLIAGTAISSSLLAERGTSIPTTQSFLNYALLTSYLVFLRRRPPRVAWWKYAVQAVIDVEANYMVSDFTRAASCCRPPPVHLAVNCGTLPFSSRFSYAAGGTGVSLYQHHQRDLAGLLRHPLCHDALLSDPRKSVSGLILLIPQLCR